MANSGTTKEAANDNVARVVGVYVGYDGDGVEVYRDESYEIGLTTIPYGLSISMKAMKILDPKTGEVLKSWNPWDVV